MSGRAPIAVATVALVLASAGDVSTRAARAEPPVYLDDPGLVGVSVRPEYISFPLKGQEWRWIRSLRWRTWGGEEARGRGLLEICSFGRCKRTQASVRLWRRLPRDCPTGSSYTRITYTASGRTRTRAARPYTCEND